LKAQLHFLAPVAIFLGLAASPAFGQFAERSSLVGSGNPDVDASGRSVKNPRVRAVHTTDPSLEGGTAYLIQRDPFLAYQLGRNLNFREFRHRDGALLVNVSRGPVVDTDALLAEVVPGRLRAALDVTDPEPLPPGHPLWSCPNVLVSPHVGGNSTAFLPRAERLVAEQLRRYVAGQPLLNVVTAGT
jgi:hypothetical protein